MSQDFSKTCNYEFLQKIGRGNYGTAWLVRRTYVSQEKRASDLGSNTEDEEHVVIKKIPLLNMKESEVDAAKSEVTLLKGLKHPNIVRTIESFEEDDCFNIVMEYCECGDLAIRIGNQAKTGKRFTRRQVLEWFVQLVAAVGHIHSKKVLHRDLKTNNVFLARNNVVKLGDFGIAKALQTASMAETVIGTPYYMSPEICKNVPYSYESDMSEAPPISPEYGADVQELLNKLLNKDHTQRPSAVAVLQDRCLREAAKFIVDNQSNTGTLGRSPPPPPPTPKKPKNARQRAKPVSREKSRSSQRHSEINSAPALKDREIVDSPRMPVPSEKLANLSKRELHKKRLLSKANGKRRSVELAMSNDAGQSSRKASNNLTSGAGRHTTTAKSNMVPSPKPPTRSISQPSVAKEYSRAEEIQRLKHAKKEKANADRYEELRRASVERMREMSTAKERMHKEFRTSSVNHSLGQMGGPLSSPVGGIELAQGETPRRSILDLASPSYNEGPRNIQQSKQQPLSSYENSADDRPIVSRYTEKLSTGGFDNGGHLNPYRSGQERLYAAATRLETRSSATENKSNTVDPSSLNSGGSQGVHEYAAGVGYSWKVDDGHSQGIIYSSDESDQYSDDDDHYAEDSDDFESDSNDGSDGQHNDREVDLKPASHEGQPKSSKWVKMDEQEVLRRENQGRRDAEEVAAQMRDFCVHADEVKPIERASSTNLRSDKTGGEQTAHSAVGGGSPSFINASMRKSYQRIRDSHWETAISGLGEHTFHEVLQVYRSVAQHGDAALDGINLPSVEDESNPTSAARKGSRRGKIKKRKPTKLTLRIMQIIGSDKAKLQLCTKVEELVFLEQTHLK